MAAETARGPSPLASRRRALIGLALVAIVGAVPRAGTERAAATVVLRVDPNTAPSAVLEALPRVGPATAAKIIAAREDRPFGDLDDLDRRVRGIGPVTRDALAPYLRFDGGSSPPSKER
jgi:DNA uptake protein ComE-like DNA-binding protein